MLTRRGCIIGGLRSHRPPDLVLRLDSLPDWDLMHERPL